MNIYSESFMFPGKSAFLSSLTLTLHDTKHSHHFVSHKRKQDHCTREAVIP